MCTVLFLDTFRCTPRKRRMSSSLEGKKFQTCGSARRFFQVLGVFSFPLRTVTNPATCSQPPTTSAVCHSGLSLPDRVLCQDGISSVFPTSSKKEYFLFTLKCTVFLRSSVSLFHRSGPLNLCAATYFSDTLEGGHTLCSGS